MSKIIEKLVTVPSYEVDKTFTFSVPYNIETLDCKLDQKARIGEELWSPWPDKKGVVRRMGGWFLKLHKTKTYERGWGKTLKKHPCEMVRPVDGADDVWYVWGENWLSLAPGANERKKSSLAPFRGRHIADVIKEDFPELLVYPWVPVDKREHCPKARKERELRTPKEIHPAILKKVYGRSSPRVEIGYTSYEFCDRRNRFQLDLEWYRKELLKVQRKINNNNKKKLAEELGVSVSDIEMQKRTEQELAEAVKLTQELIEISVDVFKTIDFLNEVVEQIGQRKKLDRKWFDKGRRKMRELSNTMRPLNKYSSKE